MKTPLKTAPKPRTRSEGRERPRGIYRINPGEPVGVVRWLLGREGWFPEHYEGQYIRSTPEHFELRLADDTVAQYPRADWELTVK